jgi:hypothetical protein
MGTRNPLEVLKKGLKVLEIHIKAKHHDLMSKVAAKTKISEEEEEWLDKGSGNTVDEVHVIDELETVSDYECGLGRLDEKYKAVVQRLWELAGDIVKVAGNKQKCESSPIFSIYKSNKTIQVQKTNQKTHWRRNQQIKVLQTLFSCTRKGKLLTSQLRY